MKTCHVSYSCTFSYCHFMSLSPLFVAILWAYHHFQINPYQDNPSFDLPQPSSWVFPTMPVLSPPRSAAQLRRVARGANGRTKTKSYWHFISSKIQQVPKDRNVFCHYFCRMCFFYLFGGLLYMISSRKDFNNKHNKTYSNEQKSGLDRPTKIFMQPKWALKQQHWVLV